MTTPKQDVQILRDHIKFSQIFFGELDRAEKEKEETNKHKENKNENCQR